MKKVVPADNAAVPVTKESKKIDPKELFGIWVDKPRSIENIRKDAWERIPGGLKGKVSLPDDFNEPLDDLKDYM
ncbi:MAG TPA: DUF2281 domain-containing protein [Mucilaginibacter sp.]|jgi:hypothetical protein